MPRHILEVGDSPVNVNICRIFCKILGPDEFYHPENFKNEKSMTLETIAPDGGDTFVYEYDFGDGWEHKIKVGKISPIDKQNFWLMCLAVDRSAQPEDVGGAGG
ncbi:MAG: hypothetical protein CMN89_10110 [Sutterellaceae bacterium]|nr:hypothetical protein [Sutterellaceae bacterium]MBT84816.1 hypothetical protein [Sutterellaceae bacterium]|tara:strand:- start:116 stop:427 length:312 start_codon:yes stop_codon:yes gene_type:complete